MNAKYGKVVDGKIVYAPSSLGTEDGVRMNPSEASYLAAGWKKVVDEPPAADGRNVAKVSRWTEDETTVTCVYRLVPKPEEGGDGGSGAGAPSVGGARTFSKLKVVIALKEANLWVLTKTWIEENGLYDHYLAARDFAEDNELFRRGKTELQQLARLTDGQVEDILARCLADK